MPPQDEISPPIDIPVCRARSTKALAVASRGRWIRCFEPSARATVDRAVAARVRAIRRPHGATELETAREPLGLAPRASSQEDGVRGALGDHRQESLEPPNNRTLVIYHHHPGKPKRSRAGVHLDRD